MDAIPIIRIELENLREQVTHAMMCHNDELNGMIAETLSKTLTEEWVKQKVHEAVIECINKAIFQLTKNTWLIELLQSEIVKTIKVK